MIDLIIVTGGSRGIGRSIVDKCAPICKNMIVIGSSDKINEVSVDGCNIIPLQLNLSDYNNTYNKIKEVISNFEIKSLGIVLCAAKLGESGGLFKENMDSWNELYQCNVLGNVSVIKACERLIKDNVKTRIAFFSGGGSCYGSPQFSGYGLSKTAIVREVENIAIEVSDFDTHIIGVSPGQILTDMLKLTIKHGAIANKQTDISVPVNFVYNFLLNNIDTKSLSGRLIHVRDDLDNVNLTENHFKLRRVE